MKYLSFFLGNLKLEAKCNIFSFSLPPPCLWTAPFSFSGMRELSSDHQPHFTYIEISLWDTGVRVSVTQNPFHHLPIPTNSPSVSKPAFLVLLSSITSGDRQLHTLWISSFILKEVAVALLSEIWKSQNNLLIISVYFWCSWHPLGMPCPRLSPVGEGERPC